MTIRLPQDVEVRLKDQARRLGLDASEYARRLITEHLPPEPTERSLDELFAKWETDDATSDPAEISRRTEELQELKESLNCTRALSEGASARKIFP